MGKISAGWLLLAGLALSSQAGEQPKSENPWQTYASVFRVEKSDIKKRALARTQSVLYVGHLNDPENPELLRRIADLTFHLGDYPRAARWYFSCLQLNPDDGEVPALFAESLYHAEGVKPALRVFEALAEHGQDTAITRALRAEIYYFTNKPEAAGALLERILEDAQHPAEGQEMALLRDLTTRNLHVVRADLDSAKTMAPTLTSTREGKE